MPHLGYMNEDVKARHCLLMLNAAAVLAECAPDDLQARGLARYSFMYADAFLLWARRWRVQLSHESATGRLAHRAKAGLKSLNDALGAGQIRDYLAAKRQPVAAMRGDDVAATALLWQTVNRSYLIAICEAANASYSELSGGDIGPAMAVDGAVLRRVNAALPARDAKFWYLAADTAADRRLYTLPAAQGGELGRIIAQINDVGNHLDALLRLAPVLVGVLPYDWLVRSALVTELNSLLSLTIGNRYVNKVSLPLIDLCRAGRAEVAADQLERIRAGIARQGWDYVRFFRNKIGAHIDDRLTMFEIHRHLIHLDYQGVIKLAEYLLNQLDALGATQVDLGLLLFGERKIKSWPVDPSVLAPGRPERPLQAGALAHLFRRVDSPFMAATASSLGSAVLAGQMAGRRPCPRPAVSIPPRPHPLLDLGLIAYKMPDGRTGISDPMPRIEALAFQLRL